MTNSSKTQTPKKRGRKAVYESPAARAAAYRARKAAKIAEALAQVAVPDTRELEAVKARLLIAQEQLQIAQSAVLDTTELEAFRKELQIAHDRILDPNNEFAKQDLQIMKLREQMARQSAVKPGKIKRSSESNRYDALRKFFVTGYYPKPDEAKRLRVNTKKAAGAASELLGALKSLDFQIRESVAADIEALEGAAALLGDYGKSLEDAQESAESVKLKRIRDQEKEHAAQVKTTIEEMFPNLATRDQEAFQMAQDLMSFEKEGEAWLMSEHRVDGANAYLENSSDVKNALIKKNAARIVHLGAEQKMRMPRKGRSYPYHEETHWSPSWGDFEEWRNRK